MDLKFFTKSNEELIDSLKQTAELIEYQEETIKELREKLSQEKEALLKDALGEEYTRLKADRDYYKDKCQDVPFFFTPEERDDYGEFREGHRYMDGDKEKICLFQACSVGITFHYKFAISGTFIEVECPYCHTRRKLGTGQDKMIGKEDEE